MKTNNTLTISGTRPLYADLTFTVIAVGLGVTLPQIFHVFGLGSAFLPMFLPVILLGLMAGYPFVMAASVITPLLSYGLTGMPPAPVAIYMIFQLALVGSLLVFMTRGKKMKYYYAIPAAIITERTFSLAGSAVIGSGYLTTGGIMGSYPGIIMLAAVSIIVMYFYGRRS